MGTIYFGGFHYARCLAGAVDRDRQSANPALEKRMREKLAKVLAWSAFLSLIFGVIPLVSLPIGYQLEERQVKPDLVVRSCDAIEKSIEEFRFDYGASLHPNFMQEYDPEKCRIAGSGSAIMWIQVGEPTTHGFIYARLSEAQIFKRIGYRTFFHDFSSDRWYWTMLFSLPWLPIILFLYTTTGSFRILPWRKI
jgi:hypothetical protein